MSKAQKSFRRHASTSLLMHEILVLQTTHVGAALAGTYGLSLVQLMGAATPAALRFGFTLPTSLWTLIVPAAAGL